jgi:hypothetical protein
VQPLFTFRFFFTQKIERDEMRCAGKTDAEKWNESEWERRDRAHARIAAKRRGEACSDGYNEIEKAHGVKSRVRIRLRGSTTSADANRPAIMSPQPALRTNVGGSLSRAP